MENPATLSVWLDADDRHQASRNRALAAVAEEEIGAASGAKVA